MISEAYGCSHRFQRARYTAPADIPEDYRWECTLTRGFPPISADAAAFRDTFSEYRRIGDDEHKTVQVVVLSWLLSPFLDVDQEFVEGQQIVNMCAETRMLVERSTFFEHCCYIKGTQS